MESMTPVTRSEIRENRGWLTALGLGFVVLGAAAVFAAFAATLATVLLFAVLLLLGGAAQVAEALTSRSDSFGWDLACGALYLLTGGLLIVDPVSGAVGLTLLLAVFFFFMGAVRLSLASRLRRAGASSGALTATGVLDLVLGALIVLGWPETAGWVIGLFLGIELIFAGVALLAASRAVSREGRAAA